MLAQWTPVSLAEGGTALATALAFAAFLSPTAAETPGLGGFRPCVLLLPVAPGGGELNSWPLKGCFGQESSRLASACSRAGNHAVLNRVE